MSQSGLQLLLHTGEVDYIVKTIRERRKATPFVGGCLFGLWRNSLKQPVIQFVTGPSKNFVNKGIEEIFSNHFYDPCADVVWNKHCLLHLGFWFCGRQEHLTKAIDEFGKSKYNVLMFVNMTNENQLSGEYFLKDNMEESSPLFKEDVLPGHSSFRKFAALTNEIKKHGFLVSPVFDEKTDLRNTMRLIENLPSRVQVEEAVTSERQWYSSEEGMMHLQLLFQYFQEAGITPDMSRDTVTQDMQFGLNGGYILDFPANFPKKMPTFHAPDGRKSELKLKGNGEVCRMVVQRIVDFLGQESSRRGGGRY